MARPMPEPAPVTAAVWFCRRLGMNDSSAWVWESIAVDPHGEEDRRSVSNHEAWAPSFETPAFALPPSLTRELRQTSRRCHADLERFVAVLHGVGRHINLLTHCLE